MQTAFLKPLPHVFAGRAIFPLTAAAAPQKDLPVFLRHKPISSRNPAI